MRVPRRALVFALTLVHAALAGAAQEIYRTVDAQGRVTYSDRPTDGAKSVKVGPANTMSQPAPTVAPPRPESAEGAPRPYNLIAITEPADGATVTDQLGDFTVRYRTEPVRQADHAVRLVLDGQPAGTNVADGVRVSGAARGEHRLMIQVLDRNGRLLGQSASVRILVVRPGPGHRPRAPG